MFEGVVKRLTDLGKTISFMESCTGGMLSNAITNVSGSSLVFKFGAVTYSNDFKVKMGVSASDIFAYTVYSREVALDMARSILKFTSSDYGVGVTGHLGSIDPNNLSGNINEVFIGICTRDKEYVYSINVTSCDRCLQKKEVLKFVCDRLLEVLDV